MGFEKLSFGEVSNLALKFKDYYNEGLNVVAQHEELEDPKIVFLLTEVTEMLRGLVEKRDQEMEELKNTSFTDDTDIEKHLKVLKLGHYLRPFFNYAHLAIKVFLSREISH